MVWFPKAASEDKVLRIFSTVFSDFRKSDLVAIAAFVNPSTIALAAFQKPSEPIGTELENTRALKRYN
jgi:hypothetical protein